MGEIKKPNPEILKEVKKYYEPERKEGGKDFDARVETIALLVTKALAQPDLQGLDKNGERTRTSADEMGLENVRALGQRVVLGEESKRIDKAAAEVAVSPEEKKVPKEGVAALIKLLIQDDKITIKTMIDIQRQADEAKRTKKTSQVEGPRDIIPAHVLAAAQDAMHQPSIPRDKEPPVSPIQGRQVG